MFIKKMSLPRRTFLRGMGAAIALPFLDAMVPALTAMAKTAAKPARRFGAVYIPNGAIMDQWIPKTVGAGFEFTPILKPLEPFANVLTVVTNLTRSHPGSQVGDHAVSAGGFLTGVWPKRTEAEDVLANTTIDQMVAKQIGQDTPFPSLEVATEDFTGYVGACSPGFNCSYMNTISWSSPTTPLPMDINPRVVFERMFGQAGTAAQRLARMRDERSILDSIAQEANTLQRGPRDARSRAGRRVSRQPARDRAAHPAHRSAQQRRGDARRADRRARLVRGARLADVRPAGGRLPGRRHARLHVHDVARAQPADVPADRRHRTASLRVASRQRREQDRPERQDQHLLRHDVREVPGEAARRRRTATARCWITR